MTVSQRETRQAWLSKNSPSPQHHHQLLHTVHESPISRGVWSTDGEAPRGLSAKADLQRLSSGTRRHGCSRRWEIEDHGLNDEPEAGESMAN